MLRRLSIDQPNHVWCADITYIQMRRGFLYLVAIMDWANCKVLAWRLSNTKDTDLYVWLVARAGGFLFRGGVVDRRRVAYLRMSRNC